MPAVYLLLHLCLTAFRVWLTLRLKPGSRLGAALGAAAVLVVVGGFVLERRSDWAWSAMGWGWPDAVFFTNLSLEGVAVLLAVLWRGAKDRGARVRAALLTPLALGVSLWSLRWFFAPVPANLGGTINAQGFCRQTTDQSCGAAAAVTLLHAHGIRATEAEMARLCLTREASAPRRSASTAAWPSAGGRRASRPA